MQLQSRLQERFYKAYIATRYRFIGNFRSISLLMDSELHVKEHRAHINTYLRRPGAKVHLYAYTWLKWERNYKRLIPKRKEQVC